MKLDPTILFYLIGLAAIVISALIQRRKRSPNTVGPAEDLSALLRYSIPDKAQVLPSVGSAARSVARDHRSGITREVLPMGQRETRSSKRFRDHDELRYAVVARLVIGPPKSLD
jgi:hypothetical protein